MKTILLLLTLTFTAFSQNVIITDSFKVYEQVPQGSVIEQYKKVREEPIKLNYHRVDGTTSIQGLGGGGYPSRELRIYEVKGKRYFVANGTVLSNWNVNYKFVGYYTETGKSVRYNQEILPVLNMVRFTSYNPVLK